MPRGNRDHGRGGQSIVELVVVLALVAIVATAVVKGIGQQSVMRMQHVHDAFTDTASGAGASGAAGSGSGASGGSSFGSGGSTGITTSGAVAP